MSVVFLVVAHPRRTIAFFTALTHLTETYQIGFGTGRLKGASGTLTLTATLMPVPVSSDPDTPIVLLTSTGEFEGTVFGVAKGTDGEDERK